MTVSFVIVAEAIRRYRLNWDHVEQDNLAISKIAPYVRSSLITLAILEAHS